MTYSQDLANGKINIKPYALTAGVTAEIDLEGGTLAGVLLEANITSTTFTVTVARTSGGTFVTCKDPEAAGIAKTYTVGATSTGYFPISPLLTAGFRFCKITFDSSETPTIYVSRRSMQ
mgnify:CR=1 FL=1|tara:strand:+ start:157 stop:513 length:357 start_codon:yes stop_codon:yes gene_type:complete